MGNLRAMIKNYYPPTNEGRALWHENMLTQAAQDALASLGFNNGEISLIQLDSSWGVRLYRTITGAYDEYMKSLTGYVHAYLDAADGTPAPLLPTPPVLPDAPTAVLAGIEARRVKWVTRGKGSTNFDPAVQGATLRIATTGTPFDPATYQADIFGLMCPAASTVSAKFRKAGGMIDAMGFSGRKIGGGAWVDLGRFLATPASVHIPIATAGQPEEWEIVAQAYQQDTAAGLPSMIHTVMVRG